jgi:hypothetical protein
VDACHGYHDNDNQGRDKGRPSPIGGRPSAG